MSFWRNTVRTQDDAKRREQDERRRGWEDGFAGREAASKTVLYAVAWRQGRAAREAEGEFDE